MSRDRVLARVRAARCPAGVDPQGALARLANPPRTAAPASLASSGAEAVARFIGAASAKGVTLIDVAHPRDIPAAVARGLEAAGASDRRVRIADLGHADLPWGDAGLDAIAGAATPDDAVGLSQGLAGIAETGTVLLVSAPGNPTTLAFLPETHVVVLDRDAVVGTFEDAIAILRASCGGRGLPRTVNFISGASRTGDIGGRIVAGAHGPRRLVILLLHNGQGAPRAP